jgi:CubicO group peptidase (beta-lactamase class C family)
MNRAARSLSCALIAFALPLAAVAGEPSTCTFDTAVTRFQTLLADAQLSGGAIEIGTRRGVLYRRYFGDYDTTTRVPIASASKLLSATRIVQLIGRGAIDVDAPVSTYLPQFTGIKGAMTMRQMFSHTSGYGNDSGSLILFNRKLTLAEAVDQIACCIEMPNGWTPGAQFAYGGISMHVGGRVAEVVVGGDWETQWQANIGAPLGVTSIDYQAFGPTTNYGIAGAAQSSLSDYGRVLHMLVNDGYGNGVRVLDTASIALLHADNVGALPVASAPPAAVPPVRYGLGNWIAPHSVPGAPPLVHSLGALGFFPFADFDRHVYGAFMIRGSTGVNDLAFPAYNEMLAAIMADIDQGCAEAVTFDPILVDSFD